MPAIVCGNTAWLDRRRATPLSTYNLVQALLDAGLPAGVVNIVSGSGSQVGIEIIEVPTSEAVRINWIE